MMTKAQQEKFDRRVEAGDYSNGLFVTGEPIIIHQELITRSLETNMPTEVISTIITYEYIKKALSDPYSEIEPDNCKEETFKILGFSKNKIKILEKELQKIAFCFEEDA